MKNTRVWTKRWSAVLGVLIFAFGTSNPWNSGAQPHSGTQVDNQVVANEQNVPKGFAQIVEKVGPSVVTIQTRRVVEPQLPPFLEDPLFRRFFGREFEEPGPRLREGIGSGVIVSEDGYILTNAHVVEDAETIRLTLQGGKEFTAEVVGKDLPTDLAVLKIDATGLPAITFADSSELKVGDMVLAVGNPFGVGQTVTMGIVSGTGRSLGGIVDYEDFIQTDASINPGNSGGALADIQGRLVGINTAIITGTGANQGIGFAVPINMARFIMEQIIEKGRVVRGFLGIYVQPLSSELARWFNVPEGEGALISGVIPDSPAEKAGLNAGDVILTLNGNSVLSSRDLRLNVAQIAPGNTVELRLLRNGKEQTVSVQLEELPTEETAEAGPQQEPPDRVGFLEGVELTDLGSRIRQELDMPRDVTGALVRSVSEGTLAHTKGLRPGDVIMEVNRKPVKNAAETIQAVRGTTGGSVLLRVWSPRVGGTLYMVLDLPSQEP